MSKSDNDAPTPDATQAEGTIAPHESAPPTDPESATQGTRFYDSPGTLDDATPSAANDGWPHVEGYEIVDVLGTGGMGVVYKARQVGLKRVVALKMILAGSQAGSKAVARFRAEAESAARLQHPNIVQIYEIGEWRSETTHAPMPFFSLEYVAGGSLASYLNGNPLPPRVAAELMLPLTDAMQYAHDQHVVHRDLKPGNILVGAECGLRSAESKDTASTSHSELRTPHCKITDFGLAKQLDSVAGETASGAILGTPSYMAPEQASGLTAEAGPLVDVYALGAILYEMLTGRPPFKGATILETLQQVRHQEPVLPSRLQPNTPRDLETICLKCLRKEPYKRYGSARELGDDVRSFLKGEPIRARHITKAERVWLWGKRNPFVALLMGGIVATFLAGVIVATVLAFKFYNEREVAKRNETRANDKHRESELRRYVAEFRGAVHKWEKSKIDEAQQILDSLAPNDGEEDLRGFEWYYLKRLCELDLRTISGHSDAVFAVAYSPDGRFLASASRDKTVRIHDRASGEVIHELRGHPDQVFSLAYSADGKRLASGGNNGTIKVWDALAGSELMTLTGHKDWVRGLAFSPDGEHLVSGGTDKILRRWNLAIRTESPLATLKEPIASLAYCPKGRFIVAGCLDGTMIVHNLSTMVTSFAAHTARIRGVAFSRDGSRLASASIDQTIKIWDTSTWQLRATLTGHTDEVSSVAFSTDGLRLVSGSVDRTVRVWDVTNSKEFLTLRGHLSAVFAVAFSPDDRHVASGGDAIIKIWDARESLERVELAGHTKPAVAVAFSPHQPLLASCGIDGAVIIWDTITGLQRRKLTDHRGELYSVAFHPTQPWLGASGQNGAVQFWDTRTWQPIELNGDQVNQWDLQTGQKIHTLKVVWPSGISRDGGRIISIGSGPLLRIRDSATGSEVLALSRATTRPGLGLALSRDGWLLASGCDDNRVYFWDATPLNPAGRIQREAVSLIRALAGQSPQADLSSRIAADRSTSDAVRQRAQELICTLNR